MRVAYTGRVPPAPLPAELVEFLKQPHAAVVATVRSDGAPYSAATWYEWDDGRILVNMDFERLRLKHLQRDPRVAITVLDLGDWYRAVTVLGRVVELRLDPLPGGGFVATCNDVTARVRTAEALHDSDRQLRRAAETLDRLSQRYRGAQYWNRGRRRVTALIEPERWHEHS